MVAHSDENWKEMVLDLFKKQNHKENLLRVALENLLEASVIMHNKMEVMEQRIHRLEEKARLNNK